MSFNMKYGNNINPAYESVISTRIKNEINSLYHHLSLSIDMTEEDKETLMNEFRLFIEKTTATACDSQELFIREQWKNINDR